MNTSSLRIVMAQLNFDLGDLSANLDKHIKAAIEARDKLHANVIVFPELSLTGYSPEDLLLRPNFISDNNTLLKQFLNQVKGIYCLVGHPQAEHGHLYNSCSLIYNGKILGRYDKKELPNYGVFDERRYFTSGETRTVFEINGLPVGILICEDLWRLQPAQIAENDGAKLIISINASPFESDKHDRRHDLMVKRATQHHLPIVYVNHVCGQDELVFDGGSMAVDAKGVLNVCAGFFKESLQPVDIALPSMHVTTTPTSIPDKLERIYDALVLGLRDYVNKNHFSRVLLGLSGGIDSALTACIAVDALGGDRVTGVLLPSRYTDKMSIDDAQALAQTLGIHTETLPIEPVFQAFLQLLAPQFENKKPDVTEQNIQARCRSTLLMALANQHHAMLLTTGNRSELAVGYCTLYGDMAGGFAVLKDVPKTLVYELADWRNQTKPLIPTRTIERPPTAELAPNQTDQDTLPPYDILDAILELYLNKSYSLQEIVAQGYEAELVERIINMVHRSEYKRYQSAVGTHINHKSFGKDWRYPLTNAFKG